MQQILSQGPKIVIVTAIAVAVMKIFGNQGILLTFAVIAVLIAAIYLYQNKLLYMPDIPGAAHAPQDNPAGYRHPSEYKIETVDVEIAAADNVRVRGWLLRSDKSERILVYFHQNAGNLGMRIPFLRKIYTQTNSDVLLVAYRGFSNSDGSPSEEGLQLDGQAILSYAIDYRNKQLEKGRKKDLYMLGRSLGGAVSIYLATQEHLKNEIKGLILENTFTSIQDMVKRLMPPLSHLQFLHRNFWPSKKRIPQLQLPILFVKSMQDEIVPPAQMSELIELATGSRLKMEHQIVTGTHNVAWQVDPPAYFAKFNEFFKQSA